MKKIDIQKILKKFEDDTFVLIFLAGVVVLGFVVLFLIQQFA